MSSLSEDDLNLRDLSDEELALAWDLWFDLAQATNDEDPPYTHGVFQLFTRTRVDSEFSLSDHEVEGPSCRTRAAVDTGR